MAVTLTPAMATNLVAAETAVIDSLRVLDPVWLDDHTVGLPWETLLAGPYRIYVDGVHVKTTYQRRYPLHVDTELPVVDVLTAEEDPTLEDARSARIILTWWPSPLAVIYRVEQYIDYMWVTLAEIPDRGEAFFEFVTEPLADDTQHQFKVIPIHASGAEKPELLITHQMVRAPDPPDVTVTYQDGSGKVTIAEA
jgi:hypothetical protein